MTHILKLLYGIDKRNPNRTLDLNEGLATSSIFLQSGGFAPAPGAAQVIWSGQTPRQDGQKYIDFSRDNIQLAITYDLTGGSPAELSSTPNPTIWTRSIIISTR